MGANKVNRRQVPKSAITGQLLTAAVPRMKVDLCMCKRPSNVWVGNSAAASIPTAHESLTYHVGLKIPVSD
jgi:hypothetical protein